ncbi:vitamin B12-dependent ribonucleotide reductase [candidate division KSB1 bacterium]|nr:vitamin B12-dependent ribonucleotide reductase [candidate division KSB1 bacterium]
MKIFGKAEQLELDSEPAQGQAEAGVAPEKLKLPRFFTKAKIHPYEEIEWETRTAFITNDKGEVIFEQSDTELPKFWSQTAINIVASKYFHSHLDSSGPEHSVRQMIDRVVRTLAGWGRQDGYFAGEEDAETFEMELTHLLVYQKASFNSPVWFNMGVEEKPQCSACFINSVEDTMEAILNLAKTEGMLFKWGSGTGTNLSTLRSSREKLSSGGHASGPVSFMRGYDAFAGVIKSGGKTRRAAKMVILDADHPDIVEYIKCKADEEKKAWALIDAGYDGSFNGVAYSSVFFQNSNNSVRVTEEFMRAVEEDGPWHTKAVTDGHVIDTLRARELMDMMTEAAHICGDPGIQFHTTVNDWHTCPNSAPINASNPCSEYMFVDNSSCNLASLNLLKFVKEDGTFDLEAYRRAIHIIIIAQEIIVDNASYPNDLITGNSHKFRPLGLGYTNLGALFLYYSLPYDSDQGRALAATLTAIMTGQAYLSSAILASAVGAFEEFEKNREPMLGVIRKHRAALENIDAELVPEGLYQGASEVWADALEMGERYGYRNAQVTVLAPTGTISFMMDCDTTGIEPDFALVKNKKMVDGGEITLVNNTVAAALQRLGYTPDQVTAMLDYLKDNKTIEGAPHLKEEHLSVFDCAQKPENGKRYIEYMGHVRMMAAVQPFISGAISKTVNMPNESTPTDIANVYMQAWKMGLKAIAIYRDNSKRIQPLSTGQSRTTADPWTKTGSRRRRLPDERRSLTHKFSIGGHEGYITVGEYDDGRPGEIFVVMAKTGSTVSGLMDAFATSVSINLQYGVPLEVLVNKFSHTRFEPYGFTNNADIPMAKSISDYLFRWLESKYLKKPDQPSQPDTAEPVDMELGPHDPSDPLSSIENIAQAQTDSPPCPVCDTIMVRSGSCYRCPNCCATSGCS